MQAIKAQIKNWQKKKEIIKECKQEALQEHIMSLIPETIDTDAGTHIYLLYKERLKIAKAVTDGLIYKFKEEVYGKA